MFFRNVTITQQYLERVRILKWVCKDTSALLTQCEAQVRFLERHLSSSSLFHLLL